jgi:CRISPR system Cascade subunit CasD
MSDKAYLALLLDGPLQSWGFASRFQRRTTGLHPTKSGVIGVICAAMGLAKGSDEEQSKLSELAKLKMTSIAIPRAPQASSVRPPVLRLEDYHTVLNTR